MVEIQMSGIEPEDLFAAVAEALRDPEKRKKLDQLPSDNYQRTMRGVYNIAMAIGAKLDEARATVKINPLAAGSSKEEMEAAVKRGMEGISPRHPK